MLTFGIVKSKILRVSHLMNQLCIYCYIEICNIYTFYGQKV